MRWIIRLEQTRQPKFGETRRDVVAWVVRPYRWIGEKPSRVRGFLGAGVPFPSLAAAHRYARGRAIVHYYARVQRTAARRSA